MGKVLKPVSRISGIYGQPGEEKVSQLLAESLPDQYVVLNSPRVYYHGGTFDIDHVVIGPNGIFVIETKNMQGIISGGIMGNWVQERTRSARISTVKIGNPANQVNQYGKVVRSYLGSRYSHETGKKVRIKVYSVVVFAHDDVDFSKMNFTRTGYMGHIRVAKLDQLVDFITNRQGASYTDTEIAEFADIIVPADQRDQTSYFSLDKLQEFSEDPLSRYELFEELGRGNFGIVFRGYDYKLDKEIAVKKLQLQSQSDPNAVNRFYREAQITSGLSHENIIGVYDYFEKSGDYYIVMEMVEGDTLEQYVREKKLSITESLGVFTDICSALQFAHEKQVIHRDLKPSNILIDLDGKIKVTDFGIAKLINSTDLTMENTGAGTPVIMSPEQITRGVTTEKSDIFSLGVVLYFILTGKMPFEGEFIGEIIHQITHLQPVPPTKLNSGITQDLEAVILKALEKDPGDRFETVADLSMAINEILTTGHLTKKIGSRWHRFIPLYLRPYLGTERKLFTTVTVISMIIFAIMFGLQSYRDSKELSNGIAVTKQLGFTNQNIRPLFENPDYYTGMPVNLVGRIKNVVDITERNTKFALSVRVNGESRERTTIVIFNRPHHAIPVAFNIEIKGSIQGFEVEKGQRIPIIVADKLEAMEDPWSFLAPSQFYAYPNKAVRQKDKIVELEKVEFSDRETRLFVNIRNEGPSNDVVVLSNPIAKQGIRELKELNNNYGVDNHNVFQLIPGQEVKVVLFLQPLDSKFKSARFILGSSNDVLMGQQPYIFDVSW